MAPPPLLRATGVPAALVLRAGLLRGAALVPFGRKRSEGNLGSTDGNNQLVPLVSVCVFCFACFLLFGGEGGLHDTLSLGGFVRVNMLLGYYCWLVLYLFFFWGGPCVLGV